MSRKAKNAGENADKLIQKIAAGANEDEPGTEPDILDEPGTSGDDDFLDGLNSDEQNNEGILDEDQGIAHKYSVLQGKYNTEMARMNTMLSDAMSKVSELTRQVEEMRLKPASANADPDYSEELEKVKAEYPTLYKGLLAAVRQEAGRMVKESTAKADERVEELERRTMVKDRETYLGALDSEIPRWKEINSHPLFIKWLNAKDRFSGKTKMELLTNAYNAMDVGTTAAFFLDFMSEKGIKNQRTRQASDDDIAPNDSGMNVSGKGKDNRVTITQAQIDKFYKDRAMGRFQGTEEDAAKFEAKIFQAVREGKVR